MFKVIFHMPRMVRSRLDHIQRNFLWERSMFGKKNPRLVRRPMVCLVRESGGLRGKGHKCPNKALFCKWSRRFAEKSGALRNDVIRANYHEKEGGMVLMQSERGIWCRGMEGNSEIMASRQC